MIRAFGGVIGTQTSPSVYTGASGIWSIRDVAYFSSLAQWPGSGSQFAAVAFTHGPDNIGGAPYLSVYRYIPGNQNVAPFGISTKYPSPSDTVGFKNYGLAFSPDNAAIGAGAGNWNYYNFYRWSDSGFGTRYNTPNDTGNLVIMDIHWNSSSNTVALACSTSGTPEYVYANGVSYTPSLYVYRWTAADGFGTKYADPVGTIPYVPERDYFTRRNVGNLVPNTYPSSTRMMLRGVGGVVFSADSGAIIHVNGDLSPQLYAYNFTPGSGFGAAIAAPAVDTSSWVSGITFYSNYILASIQLSADDKTMFYGSSCVNQINGSTGGGTGAPYENKTVSGAVTFNSGAPKTFGSLSGAQFFSNATNSLSPNTVTTFRVGKNTTMVTKGTNAATSNVSIAGVLFSRPTWNFLTSGINLNAGWLQSCLSNTNVINFYSTSLFTSDYYCNGIDISPNGREAVYTNEIGTIFQTYTRLNRAIEADFLSSNRSSPTVPNLPFGAHKIRFNNFQQNP